MGLNWRANPNFSPVLLFQKFKVLSSHGRKCTKSLDFNLKFFQKISWTMPQTPFWVRATVPSPRSFPKLPSLKPLYLPSCLLYVKAHDRKPIFHLCYLQTWRRAIRDNCTHPIDVASSPHFSSIFQTPVGLQLAITWLYWASLGSRMYSST